MGKKKATSKKKDGQGRQEEGSANRMGRDDRQLSTSEEVVFHDFREKAKRSMEKAAFIDWVEKEKLLCFNSQGAPTIEAMWWPEVWASPGLSFKFEDVLCVDAPAPQYEAYRVDLLRKAADLRTFLEGEMGMEEPAADAFKTGIQATREGAQPAAIQQNEELLQHVQAQPTEDPQSAAIQQDEAQRVEEGGNEAEVNKSELQEWPGTLEALAKFVTQEKATLDGGPKDEEEKWRNALSGKGSGKTTKELIFMMMLKIASMEIKIMSMEKDMKDVKSEMKDAHGVILSVAERAYRASFTVFIQQAYPSFHIHEPLSRVKLAYGKKASLEALAARCGKLKDGVVVQRASSNEAKIDLFLRARLSHVTAMPGEFTHFAVAEVTRSVLCHSAVEYEHPPAGCLYLTKSSKLLFKLIQLERDVCAALGHFGLALDAGTVLGACLVSPTFCDLVDPGSLLDAVFKECPGGFECLIYLHAQRRLWLLDL